MRRASDERQEDTMSTTTATAPVTTEVTAFVPNADLTEMPDTALDGLVRHSISVLAILTRRCQREMRERLMPALLEVKRRFAEGQNVAGFTTLTDYLKSVSPTPVIVRGWEFRLREAQLKQLFPAEAVDAAIYAPPAVDPADAPQDWKPTPLLPTPQRFAEDGEQKPARQSGFNGKEYLTERARVAALSKKPFMVSGSRQDMETGKMREFRVTYEEVFSTEEEAVTMATRLAAAWVA